jgi:hypothetical protein
MAKVLSTGFIVLVLIVLGLGFFTVLVYSNNVNADSNSVSDYQNKEYQMQNSPDNSVLPYTNACGSNQYSYLCFKYQMLEQEKNQGYNNKPEQIKVEPCPAPKPVCPLCYKGLDQSKGEGHIDTLDQTRINC